MGSISKFASEDSLVRFPGFKRGSSLEFRRAGVSVGQKLIHFSVSECPTPISTAKRNVRHERGKTMLIRLLTDRDAPEEAVAADPINIAPEYPDQGTSARRRPTSRKRACYVACVLLAKQENRLCALPREPPAPSRGSASTMGTCGWRY